MYFNATLLNITLNNYSNNKVTFVHGSNVKLILASSLFTSYFFITLSLFTNVFLSLKVQVKLEEANIRDKIKKCTPKQNYC